MAPRSRKRSSPLELFKLYLLVQDQETSQKLLEGTYLVGSSFQLMDVVAAKLGPGNYHLSPSFINGDSSVLAGYSYSVKITPSNWARCLVWSLIQENLLSEGITPEWIYPWHHYVCYEYFPFFPEDTSYVARSISREFWGKFLVSIDWPEAASLWANYFRELSES